MNTSPLLAPTLPWAPLVDPAAWAAATFGAVRLGDARRTRRLVAVASALAVAPGQSLPAALGRPAALKATYRLLHRKDVTVDALLAPSCAETLAAARAAAVVLLVQDQTMLDYTAHRQTTGLGPIGDGRGRGYLLHSVLAVVPPRAATPRALLGLAHLAPRLREPAPRPDERCAARRQRPRESDAWPAAVTAIGPPPPATTWVHVGDRGADAYAFLQTCHQTGIDFLIRVAQDRRAVAADGTATHVRQAAAALPAHDRRTQAVPTHAGQPARTATVAIAWAPLTVQPPVGFPDGTPIPAWVIRVWEPAPPADTPPLEWILLTSVPTTTTDQAWTRADWYAQRWVVEEYHRCLKTGCRLEASQLRDGATLWRLLGLRAPMAVRLLQLRDAARAAPDTPAATVVGDTVVAVVAAKTGTAAAGMTTQTCWRMIARLGGHQGRRHDGEPGWQTLWRGWCYVQTVLDGVHLARHLPVPADDG